MRELTPNAMKGAPNPATFSAVAVLFMCAVGLSAQLRVRPVGELPSEAALQLTLRKLASAGTFMETDAHPDDEDNALLAQMSHGRGMRTVLVTATRGDGGQNEIGPEIFQALGVLRTEELLAVHRFDGSEQYFTRAVDFGYSFSIDESIDKWGHDEIVGDYVRHIRAIRPDVVVGFVCGGGGGGQHHQASTRLTIDAFKAAADPARYPDQIRAGLRPWQAKRLFCTEFGGRPAPGARDLMTVSSSAFDPVLGRTYAELGLEARSMHKCQGTSQLLLLPGENRTRNYRLVDEVIGQPGIAPADMFDGIDTTLGGLASYAGEHPPAELTGALSSIADAVTEASRVAAATPEAAAAPLVRGLGSLRALREKLKTLTLDDTARYEIDFRLAQKEPQFEEALLLTHGIRVEALADDGTVVAGQRVKINAVAGNNGKADVTLDGVTFAGFAGFDASAVACSGAIPSHGAKSCSASLTIAKVPLSTPYWTPRSDSARYDFDPDVPFGLPFRPTPFVATFVFTIGGAKVSVRHPVEFRYSDLYAGEKRMELQVVPPFNVRVSPEIAIVSSSAPAAAGRPPAGRTIAVTVTSNVNGNVSASASLKAPDGWRVTPGTAPVTFARAEESATLSFTLTPPSHVAPGDFSVSATVADESHSSSSGYDVVEYPHIHRRHVIEDARTRVEAIDVKIAPGLRVGYIMGVGDDVPAAIQQLGADVHVIDARELASGDLSRYNVIVTGVRAYERRADLRANNNRLLDYVKNGGVVLVNYNKLEFNDAQYGPYPAKNGQERITDENAPVEILVPSDPVFNVPNKIGSGDWAGWVQERGTYFLAERDQRYVDLIRMTDPFPLNPGAKTGALVEAQYGKGRWIYLGLGLWRQLPAGTPGAYRLMANLLSLGRRTM
jgi:LmbE family N-acetylglucosaminyl deacetylase